MKRFLSGFLIIVLIFSLAPFNIMSVFAEPEFISGDSTELLNDNIRYTYGQRMEKSYGATYKATNKFVKFTGAGSGIEWEIPEDTSVKRLDFWVWPKNAIDTYEIEKTTDGETWTSVTTGDWNPDGADLGSTTDETANEFDSTYWQSVVLDEAVSDAKKLRFKITGFTDSSYGAYIAEASYSLTNEINLLARDTANNDGQSHSIYVEATTLTNNQEKIKKTVDTDFYRNLTQYPIWKPAATTSRTSIWQAVKLAGTKHKINRIVIDVNVGTGKEFEVWCSNSASDYADPDLIGKGQSHTWQKVANIKGDVQKVTNVKGELVVDIPNSPKAEYWMVRVTDRDDSTNFGLATANMGFYEMAESELSSFALGYNEIFSSATTEEKVTDSFTLNSTVATTQNGNMAVAWGCDSDLVDVSTGAVTRPDYDAQVTLSATVTNTDSREYTFYKTYTLAGTVGTAPEPDDDTPVIPDNPPADEPEDNENVVFSGKATAFGEGITGDNSLLSDNFRHTYKEWRLLVANEGLTYNNARPDKQTKKYVHFSVADSGIEWLSEFEKTVKRIDLWVWPVYGIDEYEVQSLNAGDGAWETVYTGRFNPNGESCVVESSTNTSSYFYSAVLDEPITTKGLRFVIKSFTLPEKGAYITEADVRNTNGINLAAPNALANDGMDFSIFGFAYKVPAVSGSGKLSPASEDNWRTWPSGNNVVPDSNGKLWYAVRFSDSHHIINNFALNLTGGTAKEIEVYYSNDDSAWSAPGTDTNWTKLTTLRGSFSDRVFIDATDCVGAEYWKIAVSDYTGDINITSAEVYEKAYGELSDFAKSMTEIFDDVIDGIVIEDHVNIPSVVNTENCGNLNVTWGYESDNIEIDLSNGNVSGQTAEDSKLTLLATITNSGDGTTRTINKEYWVRGVDSRARSGIINEEFNLRPETIFDKTEGTVVTNEGEAVLTGNAKAELNLSLDEAFEYKKDSNVMLTLGNNTTGGKISFYDENNLLATLKVESGKLLVGHQKGNTELDYRKNIKIEFLGDLFNVLLDSGNGYAPEVYKAGLIESGVPDKLVFETTGGEKLCVANILKDAASEDLISEVERQFDFSKISKDQTATVKGNLSLIKTLKDITFTYSATDSAVNTESGEVSTTVPKLVTLTVNAENAGASFTKAYDIMIIDAINVLTDSNVSFAGTIKPGSTTSMAIDNKLETALVSDSLSGWTMTVTMPKKAYFNKIVLHEADAESVINGYVVSVSSDGKNYTDVYTGTTITDGALIDIGMNNAQYIKIKASSVSGAGTGIKEICAFSDPTDDERVKYDIAETTDGITVPEEGTSFAKTGQFGSTITITSDDEDLVYAKESGGKWVLTFGKAKKESKVNVTITASYGDKAESKSYNIVILADGETIKNNKVSGGGGGGGYSGSTSSGGAAVISGLTNNPYESIYDVYKRELSGHWGESEIWALIEAGIVSGDGKSLNLKNTVKRAEILKMLIEAFDFETVSFSGGFLDVSSNMWYADYAETAKQFGLMEGDGVNFRGDDPITREEIAVVLINFLRRQNLNLGTDKEAVFADLNTVSSWAQDSVNKASGIGLIKGYETGEFMPKNNLMRDEAMALVSRAIDFAKKSEAEVAE